MEQEMKLREEANKEEIRKENKAQGDQRNIKMEQEMRLREEKSKEEIR